MKLAIPRHFTTFSSTPKPTRLSSCAIKELHAHYIRTHQQTNPNAMSQIIECYALSPSTLGKARTAFNQIDSPTLRVWNHMIRGISQTDTPAGALELFEEMRGQGLPGDNLTYIFLCKASAKSSDVLCGKKVQVHVLKLGFGMYLYVCNALIHMYGSCGDLGSSRKMFDEMDVKDLVSWNSLICAYSQHAKYDEVLRLFDLMRVENVKADSVTMMKVILACSYLGDWKLVDSMVKYVEDNCVEIDVYLGNTLIDVYGERGLISLAQGVFDRMTNRNIVSWNAVIKGLAKSGDLVSAKKHFDEMPERDVISWTCMITGHAKANQYNDVVRIFYEMMSAKVKPDEVTIASVLSACAHLGRLDVGMAVQEYIHKNGIISDIYVENALIDMYCKCGSIEKALAVFHKMKCKNSVSWTSVICGIAMNGESDRALKLFFQMEMEGIRPIHGTFIGVLLACVHAGLVDKGLEFFHSMQKDHGLVPEMRHYGCVVDLFCRAGYLCRAHEFILQMPIMPDAVVWRMLLSGCNLHGDMVLAKVASDMLLRLDPSNGGNYVLASNAYASSERWADALRMRKRVDEDNVVKPFGWSSVELNDGIPTVPQANG